MKKLYCLLAACVAVMNASAQQTTIVNGGKVWTGLWQQQAAEYKALCFQAYNIAALRLDQALTKHSDKPLAIITDIDETLLDNSPYDAGRAINNLDFKYKSWKTWTAKGIADTIPGGPAFFKYASQKGVEVFYITNRDTDEKAGTLKNLKFYGLPNADEAHVLFRQKGSSKESRRQQVMQRHNVILLCGDNLADFDMLYDDQPQDRSTITRQLNKAFGNKYIVIPNPNYGDWEGAIYSYKLKPAQKDSVIRVKLKTDNSANQQ